MPVNDLLLAPAPAAQPSPAPRAQSAGAITTTRVISYTYDPLGRLVEADYSTGEQFEYAYDARRPSRSHGNRTAMTDTAGTTTYEYDAKQPWLPNALTSADGVTYTWDDRGNLVSDGTFTYTYNAAGRMVACLGTNRLAESVTATLVYTYNAAGLRVAQSVDGNATSGGATTYAWDWASGVPEVLRDGASYGIVHSPVPRGPRDAGAVGR